MSDSRAVFNIGGMTCEHCVETVTNALGAIPGTKSVDVSVEQKTATVDYDDSVAKPDDFIEAVNIAGYEASLA